MRIICGFYKGKKLFSPPNDNVRPTTDRIKESIFNILSNRIDFSQARVLDLFSGSGALGLEAVSRGALSAVFVDKDRRSYELTRQNINFLGASNCEVYNTDYAVALKKLASRRFDLIFLDPPYCFDNGERLIANILENDILSQKGIIIFEQSSEKCLPKLDERYIIDTREMGNTKVSFISLVDDQH